MTKPTNQPSALQVLEAIAEQCGVNVTKKSITPEPLTQRFLDVKSAAKYCSLSRWSLSRAVRDNSLKCFKLSPGQTGKILFDVRELDLFIKRHAFVPGNKNYSCG